MLDVGCWMLDVKSVLCIAGRMICRCIQGIEAMVFVFDLGAIGYDKANFPKAPNDVLCDLGQSTEFAKRTTAAREGEISRFFGESGFEFEIGLARGQDGFKLGFG